MNDAESESKSEDDKINEAMDDDDESESESETQSINSLADFPVPAIDIKDVNNTSLSDFGDNDGYHDEASIDTDQGATATAARMTSSRKRRQKQLQKRYSHVYLELFNQTFDSSRLDYDDAREEEFADSQIGAVTWMAVEKARFFQALSKHGRHNIPKLSNAVGSKSQLEVKVFLDTLQEVFVNRQLFEPETKNVSHAEIAAAVEIGPEVEDMLEQAADTLQAMQEDYDFAAGQQTSGDKWLIDRVVAEHMQSGEIHPNDGGVPAASTDVIDDSFQGSLQNDDEFRLLHLTNWLDLSEQMFMNHAPGGTYDNWTVIAEEGQRPALTADAVRDFRHLTVSLTQRITQVAIFLAQSRIRSSMSIHQPRAKVVSKADVHAALDILNMDHDAWDFWIKLPRRNGLIPFTSSHRHGNQPRTVLSLLEAEEYLSQMSARGLSRSRSRSRSRGRSLLHDNDESVLSAVAAEHLNEYVQTRRSDESDDSAATDDEEAQTNNLHNDSENDGNHPSDSDVIDDRPRVTIMHREKRRRLLEEAQDDYMERLDQRKRQQHEAELNQILGRSQPSDSKVKDEEGDEDDIGTRPKTLRKTKEEIKDWSCSYKPEWRQDSKRRAPPADVNRQSEYELEDDGMVTGS